MARTPERQLSIDAVALFVELVHARERDQFRKAAAAVDDLERLGVHVRFRRRRKVAQSVDREEGSHA